MNDIHEAVREAVLAHVRATVPTARRNNLADAGTLGAEELFASVLDTSPSLTDEAMSPYTQFWRQSVIVAVAAAGVDDVSTRSSLNAALVGIAAAIHADPTLGGLVQALQVRPPEETQETEVLGGENTAAKLMPILVDYETGGNAMEALP
ncbi:MAG: hypothetical protein AAFR84_02375 [Pseudomonadota bacterium]